MQRVLTPCMTCSVSVTALCSESAPSSVELSSYLSLIYCTSVSVSPDSTSTLASLSLSLPFLNPSLLHQLLPTAQRVLNLNERLRASKYKADGNRVILIAGLFIFCHVDPFLWVACLSPEGLLSRCTSTIYFLKGFPPKESKTEWVT